MAAALAAAVAVVLLAAARKGLKRSKGMYQDEEKWGLGRSPSGVRGQSPGCGAGRSPAVNFQGFTFKILPFLLC